MKKYINTSNYYLSTTTSSIPNSGISGTFDVSDIVVDGVSLPLQGYYWVDVDFGDATKREIFRIKKREGYTLTYDARISPYGLHTHQSGASVGLRDFSQLLNSLSTNTDNFGEVEQLEDKKVLVRGGNVFVSGAANAFSGIRVVDDKQFTFDVNTTNYIVLELDEISGFEFQSYTDTDYLTDTGQYPIAKVTVGANMISSIEDLRSTMVYGGGEGDMKWEERREIYDKSERGLNNPDNADVYDMDNMVQGSVNLYTNAEEKDYWSAKQPLLIGEGGVGAGQNIKTIAGQSILGDGDISLDTILTVGWAFEQIPAESSEYQLLNTPLNDDAFIVMDNSGQVLTEGDGEDYLYDSETHTISFPEEIPSTETYRVWVMYDNSGQGGLVVGSGVITLKAGGTTLGSFNVNQEEAATIDVGAAANDSTITFTQGGSTIGTITTNQSSASTVAFQGNVPVTEEQYEQLPESKNTDGNWYYIVE